jgi:hypothetical protein
MVDMWMKVDVDVGQASWMKVEVGVNVGQALWKI